MCPNFRDGTLEQGQGLPALTKTVMLTADNTAVTPELATMILIGSDNTTASTRTFTLAASTVGVGHRVTLYFNTGSSTTAELADSGTMKLLTAWTPVQYDTLEVLWDGTNWNEVARGTSTGATARTLTAAHIWVGNVSNVETDVAVSGDITVSNAGVVAIASGVIVNADVKSDAAVDFSKLATLSSTNILVGSAGNVATSVAVTGDVTIGNTGVTAIGANKVTNAMLPNPVIAGLDARRTAHAIFNPSANSGERTVAPHGLTTTLPDNAIITGMWYEVITTFTSNGDLATIALSVNGANDMVSAVSIDTGTTWDAALPIEGIPKIETTSSWVKTTAAREITATVAVEALTAGLMHIWIDYIVSV